MRNIQICNFVIVLLFSFSVLNCNPKHKEENNNNLLPDPDEIVFYSKGSDFSPVIVLQSEATVTWIWADSTTSNSTSPVKDYGSALLRKNRLKVTPWSALQRINIGYDAKDGGSDSIELVADQNVSLVENLYLVAPFLKHWCSAYNEFKSLDFSNFVNIETIECLGSDSLTHVNIANTPKLRRACFEDSNLLNLDLSGSPALEDLRGASNEFNTITFSNRHENIWHLCVRDNPHLSNQNMFSNIGKFPKIAELFIWNTNQQGSLTIPSTNPNREVSIMASYNKFSSINFRGSLKNLDAYGSVEMSYNSLTSVDITGCIQIKKLDLSNNKLESIAIDQILKQVDEYGTENGTVDLRFNKPPTDQGLASIANLKKRGWIVSVD